MPAGTGRASARGDVEERLVDQLTRARVGAARFFGSGQRDVERCVACEEARGRTGERREIELDADDHRERSLTAREQIDQIIGPRKLGEPIA